MFGNPETTTGGYALKFYASMRFEIKKKSLLKKAEKVIGQEIEVRICKNKFYPPFKNVIFELIYGEGINRLGEIVDIGSSMDLMQKSGAWFSYKGQKVAQGRDNAIQFLKSSPEIMKEITDSIVKNCSSPIISLD